MGGFIPLWFSSKATKIICIAMATFNYFKGQDSRRTEIRTKICNFSFAGIAEKTLRVIIWLL